jgi:hypothetical protein
MKSSLAIHVHSWVSKLCIDLPPPRPPPAPLSPSPLKIDPMHMYGRRYIQPELYLLIILWGSQN